MAGLKLRAADAEDLAVISAILQDSLVTIGEMTYLPEERRFALVANRFRWEPDAGPAQPKRGKAERVLTGICIDGVSAVSRRGFHPRDSDRILSLLALRLEGEGAPHALILDFAGGSSVRLEVERIMCHLDDLGEPWPTRWRPKHPVADAG
ncbi:MAG TPA: DUF2948 family protein [Stellaceae bacterium]|jgi:hypothetical protein|nr:DUF2948 family protein [Stellaceae bacterium]